MASTKRKEVKQEKVVEVVQQKPVEEVKQAPPTTLHPDHLLQLEVKSRDIENAKLYMALEEQALKNMLLELQIMQRKVEDQKILLKQKAIFYETTVKQFKQLKSEIWPMYGFGQDEGLGYDPATGAIHKP